MIGLESGSPLLRVARPIPRPRIRLVGVPYAGGGASVFHAWTGVLPSDIEVCAVQLPARQDRLREPPLTRVSAIVECIGEALSLLEAAPLALFGHSFGAIVAFELARLLQSRGAAPVALIVGARRAPHSPSGEPAIFDLPEGELLEAVHRRYGTPWSVLNDSELMSLALPALRADFEALETYTCTASYELETHLTVLRGRNDTSVSRAEALEWRTLQPISFVMHEVDAGHFFIDTHRAWVLEQVSDALGRLP